MRFLIILLLFPFCVSAQTKPVAKRGVDVDKKGMVTVNGKKAFYMISKSSVPWESDYAVENLQHQQVAYFKLAKGYRYANNIKSHQEVEYYKVTFNNGAHCDVRDYMKNSNSIIKSLAMVVVKANLIKDDKINEEAVKKFVSNNSGFTTPDKADTTSALSDSAIPHSDTDSLNGNISTKDGFIYYEQQIIGTFKQSDIDTDLVSVLVYSVNKNRVAEVIHESGDKEWKIVTIVDQKRQTLPYNDVTAMSDLFRYLLKKKYL